jgi:glycosyltransferase involved in cell wall biosynthesis
VINPTTPDFSDTPVSSRRPCFDYSQGEAPAGPYVTIVTPFYNTGRVFHDTARSVLRQSFQQWEWVIVNDASTEPASLAILDEYRGKDRRIRIVDHGMNRGLSAARNTGFRAATTPYVVQLDSDDLLEPTAIEKWLWFLESYPEYGFCKGYSVGFGAQEYLWDKGFHNGKEFLDQNLVDPTSMVRRGIHAAVGGYDDANRQGLEDWHFWLRCASFGYWGGTIPEYLNWYRRRPSHTDRWTNWDHGERQRAFHAQLRQTYPGLWNGGFPQIGLRWHMPNETVPDALPCENRLQKKKPRLLMIVPWLTLGGSDKFNLDLLPQLTRRGWEITLATTVDGDHAWLPAFARHTPDIFVLPHFLRLVDYPRFLRYLIQSRRTDVVMISNSEFGYLTLPYLRAHSPGVTFLDFCHIEEERWKNGGYPRMAVEYQECLDLNLVASHHLKKWMVERGADPERIEVCHINVDCEEWRPDPVRRTTMRQDLGLDDGVDVIVYAGRICAQKQPIVFARTMARLHEQGLEFVAVVAGDGYELPELRSFLDTHGLNDRVRLLGAVSPEVMKRVMAGADLFFLPSQWEGIALSIYEAMASELPIVGAAVGGQRELVTPECGVLIAPGNADVEVDRYAEALADLLKDPERRRRLGQAGRTRVRTHFRLDQMGERMGALLAQAGKRHTGQPRPGTALALGRACAAQAVENVRLFQLCERLWAERYTTDWRVHVYRGLVLLLKPYFGALERLLAPLDRCGIAREWRAKMRQAVSR